MGGYPDLLHRPGVGMRPGSSRCHGGQTAARVHRRGRGASAGSQPRCCEYFFPHDHLRRVDWRRFGHSQNRAQIRTYKDSLTTVATDLKRAKDKFSRSALMAGGGASNRPLDFDKSA